MKHLVLVLAIGLGLGAPAAAQETNDLANAISYATAAAGPAMAVYDAFRSDDPQCRLSQLLVSAGVINGAGLLMQHVIDSPRPCRGLPGCGGNGRPSMHVGNSSIGALNSRGWRIGVSASLILGTATGRVKAGRHDVSQAFEWGPLIGLGGDALSHYIVRCDS